MKHMMLGLAAFSVLAGTVSAEAMSVAVGKDEWSLTRGEDVIAQKPQVLTNLVAGDVVAATKTSVRVTAPGTASEILVSPESSFAFDDAGAWRLIDGGAAVSTKGNGALAFETLSVNPIKAARKDDASTMYVVRRMDENTVSVQGFENRVAVVDSKSATQLGVIGPGDRMMFVRDGEAWKPTLSSVGQAGLFRAQTNPDDTAGGDEDKSTDRRKAALLIGGIAGAAVVAGGTYYVVESQNDDDNNDDNQQNKTSTKPR